MDSTNMGRPARKLDATDDVDPRQLDAGMDHRSTELGRVWTDNSPVDR